MVSADHLLFCTPRVFCIPCTIVSFIPLIVPHFPCLVDNNLLEGRHRSILSICHCACWFSHSTMFWNTHRGFCHKCVSKEFSHINSLLILSVPWARSPWMTAAYLLFIPSPPMTPTLNPRAHLIVLVFSFSADLQGF